MNKKLSDHVNVGTDKSSGKKNVNKSGGKKVSNIHRQ
jgi:hypothetical protein